MKDDARFAAGLRVADFDFDLPSELIAQEPPAERGSSRMLVMDRTTGTVRDSHFAELPSLLLPGDLLVLNDSRVIPARLYAHRATQGNRNLRASTYAPCPILDASFASSVGGHDPPHRHSGRIEVLLTEPCGDNRWRALVKPGRKIQVGEHLVFPSPSGAIELEAEVLERGEFGERLIEFALVDNFFTVLDRIGRVPLPPYVRRDDAAVDRERYQTVFSRERGSVAAPTAGLHFTPQILASLAARGIEIAHVTLHVGLGTFAPLRVERVDQVHLHCERYTIPAATAEATNRAVREGRRIVAVGTTVVRTLEAAALRARGGELTPHSGTTDIFISPGFDFRIAAALLTNFHLPQSSLLMLVSAFAGRERVLAAYRHAVEQEYRFFSYGDCMFIG